jgi:hypothetical protein
MAKATTGKSLTHVNIVLANDAMPELLPEPTSVTEVLRLALIERPGEAGALGSTWIVRDVAERQAAHFCGARPSDSVASATGDYHARVYELPGGMWNVVVWYEMVD